LPSKIKISKENILNAAFEIVRNQGIEELNVRDIAKRLECSVQPIYYQFKNVEELQKELHVKIEKYFHSFLLEHTDSEIPVYKQVGINYIKFAKKESKLFQILFMAESGLSPRDFATPDDGDFRELAKYIKMSTNLNDDEVKEFHIKMWIFTHGLATLVASNTCNLTDEQISNFLTSEFQALMLLNKNSGNKTI